jgi:hypothetical protein
VTKLRADDLTVLQSVPTNAGPIGITYEPTRDQLWIACYTGSIQIFSDTCQPFALAASRTSTSKLALASRRGCLACGTSSGTTSSPVTRRSEQR